MLRKLSKTIVFAIAVIVVAAPFALAQTYGAGSTPGGQMGPGTTSTPSSQMGPGSTSTPSTPSSQMGTMSDRDAIHATVADVNHQHKTLKLKMQGGETVEFKVPEQSLTNLNKGDSVQVSIHKAEGHSGLSTQPAQPARPQSGRPESGTKSQ
jgi:hypothetical protein